VQTDTNITGATGWSGGGGVGVAKSTTGIRKFNLRKSQVRRKKKIGFSQFLTYIHPFLPLPIQFSFPSLKPTDKK
jgi:hypothetical protein